MKADLKAKWQPIETAPKDGDHVIIAGRYPLKRPDCASLGECDEVFHAALAVGEEYE